MTTGGRAALVTAVLLGAIAPRVAAQQETRPPRRRPPVQAAPVDTTRANQPRAPRAPTGRAPSVPGADTTAAADSIKWSTPDSVMAALLEKPGYEVTRYEGAVVTFDAINSAFAIAANAAQKAQVLRDGQMVSTDSLIVYRDKADSVQVTGDFQILPGQGQPPIAGVGSASYSLKDREGTLTNARVTVEESGERWFIESAIGKTALGDSTRGVATRYYGLGGTLTSCEDSVPDYHFRLQEIKRTNRTLVARPAVMYIQDIPVLWLPFVFQDIRPGRRSGVLPPRFGASDIVRNNPGYRRHVENIGYYWAISDYMDATAWVDWRSAAGGDSLDPGWYRLNGEWKYSWLSRFLSGRLAAGYQQERDGDNNLAVSWGHQQRFSSDRNLTANVNYVTSTRLQRQNTFNPTQAMATIHSSVSFSDKIGPATLSLGGTRTQYPGRKTVEQSLPSISLTTSPIDVASWLTWTPSFSFGESATLHIDQPGTFTTRVRPGTGGTVLDTIDRNHYHRDISIGMPIEIFGYNLANNIRISDDYNDYPDQRIIFPGADSARKETRIFAQTFKTSVDWNPMFSLPPFFQNRFKLTPSVSLSNVAGGPFWVRTEQSGGRWVSQNKRLVYGLSMSPTIYGLWPGFGPFSRIRHAVSPTITYNYAPEARVNREYLEAIGSSYQLDRGALRQNSISFGLSQNIEAKALGPADTAANAPGQKLKLLSTQFSPLTYDFERARVAGRALAGLTTERVSVRATSDLLPGFDFAMDYSLFQGSTQTDTAEFDPFLTRVTSTFRINQNENPFAVISRLFGRAVPERSPSPMVGDLGASRQTGALAREIAVQPVAGQAARGAEFVVPPSRGWEVSLNFSTSRSRRPRGGTVIEFDPHVRCEQYREINALAYDQCLATPISEEAIPATTAGAPFLLLPAQTSLGGNLNFELTRQWSASWQSTYDFEESQFAAHVVSLQRDLHDFRAVFAFTKSPNGNFAFNFFIALKPQPELKFDYSRATIRGR